MCISNIINQSILYIFGGYIFYLSLLYIIITHLCLINSFAGFSFFYSILSFHVSLTMGICPLHVIIFLYFPHYFYSPQLSTIENSRCFFHTLKIFPTVFHFILLISFLSPSCHSMWEILLVLTPFFFLNLLQFDNCMCECILNVIHLWLL